MVSASAERSEGETVGEGADVLLSAARRRRRRARFARCACLVLLLPLVAIGAFYLVRWLRVGPLCEDPHLPPPREGGSVRLLLMRHAQSENNARWWAKLFFGKRDPMITPKGWAQAEAAAAALNGTAPHLVFSSHLMRAMEMANLAFGGAPVVVAPHIAETGGGCFLSPGSCADDRARQRRALAGAGFDVAAAFDWSLVADDGVDPPDWPRFVQWLWAQERVRAAVRAHGAATTIAIVSHGNFLWHDVLPCGVGHPSNTKTFAAAIDVPSGAWHAAPGVSVSEVLLQPYVRDVSVVYAP